MQISLVLRRTLCGFPFKKLDKKSEKHFLFSRRQQLTNMLQSETEPELILELTIMILFQQVKNVVVSGSLLRGPILDMLIQERKISEHVSKKLTTLNEAINRGMQADADLVNAVREFGLCRDIGKHKPSTTEKGKH